MYMQLLNSEMPQTFQPKAKGNARTGKKKKKKKKKRRKKKITTILSEMEATPGKKDCNGAE